jgi:CRP-like cAMP-binding protein
MHSIPAVAPVPPLVEPLLGIEPAAPNHEVLARLRAHPLFRMIDPRRLEQVAEKAVLTKYRAGRKVVREGETGGGVCVLVAGGVRVTHRAPGSEEGDAVVKLLGAPSLFGESEALMGAPSLESVVTVIPSEVVRIPRDVFDRIARTEPRFAYALVRDLVERLCIAREHERALAFAPVESRLASFLLDHAKLFSVQLQGGGILLEVRLSQQLLASSLAVSRKTINQTMRRWSDEGLIAKRRGRYVILEMGGLEKKSVGSSFGLAHRSRPIV